MISAKPVVWLAHHPVVQRIGKGVGHWFKRVIGGVLEVLLPAPANVPVEAVRDVRRVLIVRPNFRIGNTLISTPLISALRERFPGAQLDYLCGDTTTPLLAHLPLDNVYPISRRFVIRPWQFVALFVRLHRKHYDVAVEGSMNSFSAGLYTYLTGARYRIGRCGKADRFLNVRLPLVPVTHAYASIPAFAGQLGVSCPERPLYAVSAAEQAAALNVLRRLRLAADSTVLPFVGLFVGGHLKKRWPSARWIELAQSLAGAGSRVLVFLGPEEVPLESEYRRKLPANVLILPPQPLRLFAALWGMAQLVVTPDSGPVHLAAALGIPAIMLLQTEVSRNYVPRAGQDRVLVRPTAADAFAAVISHPAWPNHLQATG